MSQPSAIEQFKQQSDAIRLELDALRVSNIESEKEIKKAGIEVAKKKLDADIQLKLQESSLEAQEREELEKIAKEVAALDTTTTSLTSLDQEVQSTVEEGDEVETTAKSEPEGFWGKTKVAFSSTGDFVKNQWTDARDREKWKTEKGKNSLRAAVFGLTGVGLGVLAYKGIKSLREKWKARKERKNLAKEQKNNSNQQNNSSTTQPSIVIHNEGEKKNWRQRNWGRVMGGLGLAGVGAGLSYAFKDHVHKVPLIGNWLDEKINKPEVGLDDAFTNFKADISGSIMEETFKINPNASYEQLNEDTISLKTYGASININIKNRTVEGMEGVRFKDYKELLHAANIINFCEVNFRGKCRNDTPFNTTRLGGDIAVELADGENKEFLSAQGIPMGKIAGGGVMALTTILGFIYGGPALGSVGATLGLGAIGGGHLLDTSDTVSKTAPTLNKSHNKEMFVARLNRIPGLTQGDQIREDPNKHPLQPYVNKLLDELEGTEVKSDYDKRGNERFLQVDQDPKDPNKYYAKSYKRNMGPTVLRYENNKITIEGLEGLSFDVEEGLRVANLTNKIKSEYAGRGKNKTPFVYRGNLTTLKHPGLYINTKERNTNRTDLHGYQIVKESTLKIKYPLLYQNIETHYIPYLHSMRNEHNRSLWPK